MDASLTRTQAVSHARQTGRRQLEDARRPEAKRRAVGGPARRMAAGGCAGDRGLRAFSLLVAGAGSLVGIAACLGCPERERTPGGRAYRRSCGGDGCGVWLPIFDRRAFGTARGAWRDR